MARILVIEDNPDNLKLMIYLLRAFGHDTLEAVDGEQGIAIAIQELPDLITSDIQLPKVDGFEVAKQLKRHARSARIPLLAVTALAMLGDREKVLAHGFDGYLPKPIDPQGFVGELEKYLTPSLSREGR